MCKVDNSKFCSLHLHSQFSQRDGAISIRKLVDKCKDEYSQDAVCITDHGTMASAWELYNYGLNIRKDKIKPIAGCEFYFNPRRDELMDFLKVQDEVEDKKERKAKRDELSQRFHMTSVALNRTGYYNMIKMHNEAWVNGYYHRPQLKSSTIEDNAEGVAVFSGCQSGYIPSLLMEGKYDEAKKALDWFKSIYKDRFYIELMPINSKVQRPLNEQLIEMAQSTKTPMIVTTDSHYMNPQDAELHFILLNLDRLKMQDEDPEKKQQMWEFDVDDLWVKSGEHVLQSWKESHKSPVFTEKVFEECMDNVAGIVQQVSLYDLETAPMLPKLAEDEWTMFSELCVDGFKEKVAKGLIPQNRLKEYRQRLMYEMDTIKNVKAVDYLLACWDIARFCKEKDIAMGSGRGSAAGSLVCYFLGITNIDPIRWGLLFERFMNTERVAKMKFDL